MWLFVILKECRTGVYIVAAGGPWTPYIWWEINSALDSSTGTCPGGAERHLLSCDWPVSPVPEQAGSTLSRVTQMAKRGPVKRQNGPDGQ